LPQGNERALTQFKMPNYRLAVCQVHCAIVVNATLNEELLATLYNQLNDIPKLLQVSAENY